MLSRDLRVKAIKGITALRGKPILLPKLIDNSSRLNKGNHGCDGVWI